MKILPYDTETTGLPLFKEPSEDPRQPHIVELAALLIDDREGHIIEVVHHIIRPDGWSWTEEDEAFKAHGITMERAMDEGIPEAEAVHHFIELSKQSDMRVGHNESFDARIMRIALKRYGDGINDGDAHWSQLTQEARDAIADEFAAKPKFCTMRASTKACALPPTEKQAKAFGAGSFKNPTLSEAYKHFFGIDFDGAHQALNDAKGCADLFFAIQGVDPAAILARRT